ncbi:MAG TPA: hypothetical protein VIR59_14945 [Gaiellaceae bacterium]
MRSVSEEHANRGDPDANEHEYVPLRRFAVWMLESLDRALGLSLFEPPDEPVSMPPNANEHDPGVTLLELLAYAADALAEYADRVAAEERLRTRRRAVSVAAAAAALAAAFVWCRRRR